MLNVRPAWSAARRLRAQLTRAAAMLAGRSFAHLLKAAPVYRRATAPAGRIVCFTGMLIGIAIVSGGGDGTAQAGRG